MIIYADGIFDLLHSGHIRHFKKIKELYPDSILVIGVISDTVSENYKRLPILNESIRYKMIKACRYVDKVILNCPFIVDNNFIEKENIDLVVHAFSDDMDYEKQKKCFVNVIALGKFRRIDYHIDISTSKIINDWHTIWEKKGRETTNDLVTLSGWENTDYDANTVYLDIKNRLDIKQTDKVLEIGCGSGCSSNFFKDSCDYYGIDYSKSLVERNILTTLSKIFNAEARNTPFHSNFFDKIFCCGVFEYFPNIDYLQDVLKEIERIGKYGCKVYLVGIRHKTHDKKLSKHKYEGVFKHTLFTPNNFPNYTKIPSIMGSNERFSMIKL